MPKKPPVCTGDGCTLPPLEGLAVCRLHNLGNNDLPERPDPMDGPSEDDRRG